MHSNTWFGTPVESLGGIDGTTIPLRFTALPQEVHALRETVAVSDISHTAVIRIGGPAAGALVDRICPCMLTLKPNQMVQSILINDQSKIFADVYICRDQHEWFVLSRGVRPSDLCAWLSAQKPATEDAAIEALNDSHALFSVSGPFAWEHMADLEEPEIISLPYLSFYRPDDNRIIFRAGETGEFGYYILLPKEQAESSWRRILETGAGFGAAPAGHDALVYCMLENNFFNIYSEGVAGETPAELQIQWRVSYAKQFAFSRQLAALHGRPLTRRLTAVYSPKEAAANAAIRLDERVIGSVVQGHPFLHGPGWIGCAMIDMPYAVSGVHEYTVETAAGRAPLRTVSTPFVNNRSLYIDPQLHSIHERDRITFPPLYTEG